MGCEFGNKADAVRARLCKGDLKGSFIIYRYSSKTYQADAKSQQKPLAQQWCQDTQLQPALRAWQHDMCTTRPVQTGAYSGMYQTVLQHAPDYDPHQICVMGATSHECPDVSIDIYVSIDL